MKSLIIYWSMSGNTESIAQKIAGDVAGDVVQVSNVDLSKIDEYDTIIFGCPAMGSEELEDTEFRPGYEAVMDKVKDQRIFLFGSFGWGDGEFMRNWEEEIPTSNFKGSIIAQGDADALDADEYSEFIKKING